VPRTFKHPIRDSFPPTSADWTGAVPQADRRYRHPRPLLNRGLPSVMDTSAKRGRIPFAGNWIRPLFLLFLLLREIGSDPFSWDPAPFPGPLFLGRLQWRDRGWRSITGAGYGSSIRQNLPRKWTACCQTVRAQSGNKGRNSLFPNLAYCVENPVLC